MTMLNTHNIADAICADKPDYAIAIVRPDFGQYPEWHQFNNEGTIKEKEPGKEM